eukprot:1161508-Pelagomonas_calceolata.AAC.5
MRGTSLDLVYHCVGLTARQNLQGPPAGLSAFLIWHNKPSHHQMHTTTATKKPALQWQRLNPNAERDRDIHCWPHRSSLACVRGENMRVVVQERMRRHKGEGAQERKLRR